MSFVCSPASLGVLYNVIERRTGLSIDSIQRTPVDQLRAEVESRYGGRTEFTLYGAPVGYVLILDESVPLIGATRR